jgi:predicted transcriptional regulator
MSTYFGNNMKNKKKVLKLQLQDIQINKLITLLKDLTNSEYKVYKTLVKYIEEKGYSPVLAEIGEELKISRQAVGKFVQKLEEKGYLRRVGRERIVLTFKDVGLVLQNIDIEKIRPQLDNLKTLFDEGKITQEVWEDLQRMILQLPGKKTQY